MSIKEKIDLYRDDFELFETPNEKLEYIFDLGKRHINLPESLKNDKSFIVGCSSPAWLVAECKEGRLFLKGEGSSEMAKGMLVLLLDIFNGAKVDEILEFDPKYLETLGIIELLSPVRQQSLEAFLKKLYTYASECKKSQ